MKPLALTPKERLFLAVLLRSGAASHLLLEQTLWPNARMPAGSLKVLACRLRKRGVAVRCVYGHGYHLDEVTRAAIAARFGADVSAAPADPHALALAGAAL